MKLWSNDSQGCDTPGRFIKIRISQQILTKIENILTHWSVTQAGSKDEKEGGPKFRWTVPLKCTMYRTELVN